MKVNLTVISGFTFIVLWIGSFTYQGFSDTPRSLAFANETSDSGQTVPLPHLLGGLALATGTVLMMGSRKF